MQNHIRCQCDTDNPHYIYTPNAYDVVYVVDCVSFTVSLFAVA